MTAKDTYLSLTRALTECRVRHAYWKPVDGLQDLFVNPAKDFDLFIEASRTDTLDKLLSELGWKRFEPQRSGTLPGSEHRLSRFEGESPALLHLHVHRQLVIGPAPQYERFIPNAEVLLERTREFEGVPVLSAAGATLVLLCRTAFEPKLQCDAREPSQKSLRRIRADWSEAGPQELRALSRKLWGEQRSLEALFETSEPSDAQIEHAVRIMEHITPRRDTAAACMAKRAMRSATDFARSRASRMPRVTDGPRRGLRGAQHGLIVSVVGPDGAGKSTLIESLQAWLGPVETHYIHLGRGDGFTSALDMLARFKWGALSLVGKKPPEPSREHVGPTEDSIKPMARREGRTPPADDQTYSDLHMAKYAALAERKLYDLERAGRLRSDGAIIITDRFPMGHSPYLDGPKLQQTQASGWRKHLRDFEADCYTKIFRIQPDILFRLHISPEECIRRKPDHDPQEVFRKAEALYAANPNSKLTIEIDATRPASEVFYIARDAIWENL